MTNRTTSAQVWAVLQHLATHHADRQHLPVGSTRVAGFIDAVADGQRVIEPFAGALVVDPAELAAPADEIDWPTVLAVALEFMTPAQRAALVVGIPEALRLAGPLDRVAVSDQCSRLGRQLVAQLRHAAAAGRRQVRFLAKVG